LAAGIAVAKVGTAAVTLQELQELMATTQKGSSAHKLCSAQQLVKEVAKLKSMGKTVVMTNGCFDILHPGHIEYLERARALGDVLVLALNSDRSVRQLKGEGRPVNPLPTRARMLGALSCVDMVTEFDEETPEALIASVLPNILVKGGDYQVDQIAGAKQVQAAGGQVLVLDFLEGHSTTHLIEKIKGTAP
jgi:D-beta-D-heptose 7-phosphate kinase/D-beta-D-heptose 1-phosphate adenosyltransferase